jgi:hypothetical protein
LVLECADTLVDAAQILRALNPSSPFNLFVADLVTGEARVFEIDQDGVAARKPDSIGGLACTNHFLTKSSQSPGTSEDRYEAIDWAIRAQEYYPRSLINTFDSSPVLNPGTLLRIVVHGTDVYEQLAGHQLEKIKLPFEFSL